MPPPSRPFPPYDGKRYDVATSVGYQLFCVTTMMRREIELRMAAHGITDAQWKPLWMLERGRAATAIELARELDIDAGAVTRVVDRLVAKGLIERVRSDADRRVVHLSLTAAGRAVTARIPHVLAAVNNDFLRGFSEADWKQMLRLLGDMTANGNALQAEKEAS